MTVCCFCEEWGTGGIESFLLNIMKHLDCSDIRLDIVTTRKKSELYLPRVEAMDIEFLELAGTPRKLLRNHRLFRALIREKRYDIVYLNLYQALSLLYLADAKRGGVKIRIAHSHNNGLRKSFLRPLKLLIHAISKRLFARRATSLWACSQAAGRFMFPPKTPFLVIPNGIESQRFRFQPDERARWRKELKLENKWVIGNVGRLCNQKNQMFLLFILKELIKLHPQTCLLLVGDGEDQAKLQKKADILGLKEYVLFQKPTNDVPQFLWSMDAFVFPSKFEGLGIAAVEAQAAGLRVLCSDNVPREARVTPLAEFIPLSAGAQTWARKIKPSMESTRREAATLVKNAGYDIDDVARMIQALWNAEIGKRLSKEAL